MQTDLKPNYREGKKLLQISEKKGEKLDVCSTINKEYVCCNVQVLRSVSNCPFDCSYCFLQNYLTDGTTSVVGETEKLMDEVREKTDRQPWRFFRIGTWDLGDSLALEEKTGSASQLIQAFTKFPNALLELKTKSDVVDPILNLDHQGRTIVSWSMNPDRIIRREEHRTARLHERLRAMEKVQKAGYPIGLHFDPMIHFDEWESDYEELARQIFEVVSPERIAWISIGSLRFNPEMKKKMEDHFPGSALTSAEMILGSDHKIRYVKPMRVKMYQHLYQALRKYGGESPFVYLCMERWDVWTRVFGHSPRSIGHLDYLMTESLYQKFPGLVHVAPDLNLYDPESQ